MKLLLAICSLSFVLLLSQTGFANGEDDLMPYKKRTTYKITKTSFDKNLSGNEAEFAFTFVDAHNNKLYNGIAITCNLNTMDVKADKNGVFNLRLKPGDYQFYFNKALYYEVTTDTIPIKAQNRIEIKVNFDLEQRRMQTKKPVVYVYAQEKTDVTVNLSVNGILNFTYPEYKNEWKFTAQPDGKLSFGEQTYNYLFWDGDIAYTSEDYPTNTGFLVATDTLLSFMEHSLETMGFTSQEKQDFITFWYPELHKNKFNKVRFLFENTCSKYAPLIISPKPDTFIRVWMVWEKADGNSVPFTRQVLPRFGRTGLTVFEWGGAEMVVGS